MTYREKSFGSASIMLPVINETESLRKTIEIIEAECGADVRDFIFVVCGKTSPQSLAICQSFHEKDPARFQLHHQRLPFLGGALREAFQLATGSHVVMMASDLETDPHDVKTLIARARTRPDAIITASRWRGEGGFEGYNRVKLVSNFVFQKFFSTLYRTDLTDMTYGYRIFPTALVQSIDWEELRHPFLFETLLKPLRLGVPVEEIPSVWRARREGESQNTFARNFEYFRIGLRTRFRAPERLLRRPLS